MGSRVTSIQAMEIRRDAAVRLAHAIARIGYWDAKGWLMCEPSVRDAVYILQQAKWSIEAMDSPATNPFLDQQRREYSAMLEEL